MNVQAANSRPFSIPSWADAVRRVALIALATCIAATSDGRAQSFSRRWSGAISDVFTPDGLREYGVEDGGRMRSHHSGGGPWIDFPPFHPLCDPGLPAVVKDTLRRVHAVIDIYGQVNLWAVGLSGWMTRTTDGGCTWDLTTQFTAVLPNLDGPNEDLQDVHFLTSQRGWVAGLRGIWKTNTGGQAWTPCQVRINGVVLTPSDYQSKHIKIRAMDIVTVAGPLPPEGLDPFVVGLACAEPGYIFRTTDGGTWDRVFDIQDACLNGTIPANMAAHICEEPYPPPANPANFEPWDIEMSRHTAQKLALFVGGYGTGTGLIFASGDDGLTWAPEHHECACAGPGCKDCTTDPLYSYNPSNPQGVYRHQYFRTLYGVSIFNENNSAVAVGHDGQHLVRIPLSPAGTGVWQDRSSFNENYLTAPAAVVYPLHGVMAEPRLGQPPQRCVVTGWGGHIRESSDGGHTWTDAVPGDPHPIQNIRFFDVSPFNDGWQMGKFFRTARTADEGVTWTQALPLPELALPNLRAMDFGSDNMNGVCVGDLDPATSNTKPRILYTIDNAGGGSWDTANVDMTGAAAAGKLNDVTWVTGQNFWACGDHGLIMKSVNGGALWRYFPTTGGQDEDLFLKGIAFKDSTTGIVVGKRVAGQPLGIAFQIKVGADPNFTDISPTAQADSDITFIADVEIVPGGQAAYAVGERVSPTGVKTGVFLRSYLGGDGNFGPFATITGGLAMPPVPACQAGADLSSAHDPGEGSSDVAVLNEIELPDNPDAYWIGGECGRVWKFKPSEGGWNELKSSTDTHITGLSAVNSGNTVYLGGYRFNQTGQCIVRYGQ